MTISLASNSTAVVSDPAQLGYMTVTPPITDSPALDAAIRRVMLLLQAKLDPASAPTDPAHPTDLPMLQPPATPGHVSTGLSNPAPKRSKPAPGSVSSGVPGAPNTVPQRDDHPTDPTQSVSDYENANHGLLKNLGNQEGVQDQLKQRYGDWTDTTRSATDREQSAYNAARHVGIIKHKNAAGGGQRSNDVRNNGKMEGATIDGDIRDGTEMADLKNSLKGAPKDDDTSNQRWDAGDKSTNDVLHNPNLKVKTDDHVTEGGTNIDNDEAF